MKAVAVGDRSFVAGFQLAGISGISVQGSEDMLSKIQSLMDKSDIGLILVSGEVVNEVRERLIAIRSKRSVPIIFEVPAPGSKMQRIDYRSMLKQILGV